MNSEREELRAIEIALYKKFKHLERDNFFIEKRVDYDDNGIVDYDTMIDYLAETVQQHLWDEDLKIEQIDEIEEKLWDTWLEEYEVPEPSCPYCSGRGCNYCLMCSY